VNLVGRRLAEYDDRIPGKRLKGFVVIEGERRDNDAHADLKSTFDF
jgi:hypothetical protein